MECQEVHWEEVLRLRNSRRAKRFELQTNENVFNFRFSFNFHDHPEPIWPQLLCTTQTKIILLNVRNESHINLGVAGRSNRREMINDPSAPLSSVRRDKKKQKDRPRKKGRKQLKSKKSESSVWLHGVKLGSRPPTR